MSRYEERLAQHQKFEAEIAEETRKSELLELAYKRGYLSVEEMEAAEKRAQNNAQVRENQKRYFSEQERQQTLAHNRSRIQSEPVPDLCAGLEPNPDLSSLDAGQRALVEVHAAQAASQQANEFVRSEPRYVKGNESQQALIGFMLRNDLAPTAENFRASFDILAQHGLISVRQVESEAAPAPTPMPAVKPEPAPVAPDVNAGKTLCSDGQYRTEAELDRILEEDDVLYRRLLNLNYGARVKRVTTALGFDAYEDSNEVIGKP